MKNWSILPTGLGLGFALVVFLLLLIAVNFSNNLIFTLSFFLMSALLLSTWFSVRNLSYIQLVNVRVKPVHSGQKLNYQVSVKSLSTSDHIYIEIEGSDTHFYLASNEDNVWHLNLSTFSRGLIPERPLFIECYWPLGLFKVSRKLGYLPEALVYPAAENVSELHEMYSGQAAHTQSEAEELDGLREYQPGDNVKRIDWRAVARRQQLQVKHFDGANGDPSLWLEWQATQGLDYEQRIRCLCHWILDCQQLGREFGLRLPHIEVEPERSGQHVQSCLSELALMPQESSS